ncbi:hypothetical protein MNBD_GAMMA05-2168 [hydrothermal vent metagenome]|uniref:Cytochrome c domain-containing protein n=1 Tax=hydrothermal vent metagenome TaxID=652676 RepID=A0A3B0X266_9ZZZZ
MRLLTPLYRMTGIFSGRTVLSTLLTLFLLFMVASCSRDGDVEVDASIKLNEPNSFAAFINPLAGLASGDYVIEVNTDTAGDAGSFTLTVSYDGGTEEEFTGSWTATTSTRNIDITLYTAGGVTITLTSSVENNLRLLHSNGSVIATAGAIATGDSIISLETSRIDSAAYGAAYYATIDPTSVKDTLEKWKVENGFYDVAADRIIQPRFRDTKDLGYGRGMRMWTKSDGSLYFFVENFQVRTLPGEAYTTLNLEALLTDARQHHFGSNAIEFSTYPYGPGEPCGFDSTAACAISDPNPPKFNKFFTFDATLGNQKAEDHENETRLDEVNLDGRGDKAMPGACVYCHGGTLRPLRADGTFRDNTLNGTAGNDIDGDVNAKLQLLEVPSLEYGDYSPYTKAEQEPIIKQVNQAIYCTYPNLPAAGIQAACAQFCNDPSNTVDCDGNGNSLEAILTCKDSANTVDCDGLGNNLAAVLVGGNTLQGQWTGDFARVMSEGWYDDPDVVGAFDRDTYNDDFVPLEWRHTTPTIAIPNPPPPGSEQLFLEVVQPFCFVCHSRRGSNLGSVDTRSTGKDIDFNSYEKFISHADQIKLYVFDRGIMPLSLRGFNAFWDEDSDAPQILAAHLNGVLDVDNLIPLNNENKVNLPGAPVADAGPDRTTTSPVRLFGSNSRFVSSYLWSITSEPTGSDAVLIDTATSRPLLTTSVDGDYEVSLTATFNGVLSTDVVRIKIDNGLTNATTPLDPKTLTFDANIKPIFGNAGGSDGRECNHCHSVAGGTGTPIPGVPVYWNDVDNDAADRTFYEEVLARVDFNDPENSLILTKPSNAHHYGGLRGGFEVSNPANRQNYDLFLNWIMEGAPEN